jgi:hypothetical protein
MWSIEGIVRRRVLVEKRSQSILVNLAPQQKRDWPTGLIEDA